MNEFWHGFYWNKWNFEFGRGFPPRGETTKYLAAMIESLESWLQNANHLGRQ